MKKVLLLILLILVLLIGCKKPIDDKIKVVYPDEYTHGYIEANNEIYICGYQDRICPNDYSPHKPVCEVEDPDCI